MIDFNNLEQYRENNQIEAKTARGGLPRSIWETYSSFANTQGGVILLGVAENSEGTFQVTGLSDPERLLKEFWNTVNNVQKVSRNILSGKLAVIQEVKGKKIVVITVPKADRRDRPVYIGNNPFTGAYRRNGEGDYRCTHEEVQTMLRDQAEQSQDTLLLEQMDMDVFDYDSVSRYRNRMRNNRPGHVWEDFDDAQFLYRLGAAGCSADGKMHPTAAGLLMFGYDYEIVKEFSHYFLDYQEKLDESTRWTDRICSGTGSWSGNVFDFYFKVYNRIAEDIKVPFKIENGLERVDDTPVHIALREALANCLINADYHGRRGIVITKKQNEILLSNPGDFRIDIKDAICGGISDPRNATLIKMFNLVNIGERSGSGIPMIYAVWERQGWPAPKFTEDFNPDRISLQLALSKDKKAPIKSADKKAPIKSADKKISEKLAGQRRTVLCYLEDHGPASSGELMEVLHLGASRVKWILRDMAADGLLIAEGANRNRRYRIAAEHFEDD